MHWNRTSSRRCMWLVAHRSSTMPPILTIDRWLMNWSVAFRFTDPSMSAINPHAPVELAWEEPPVVRWHALCVTFGKPAKHQSAELFNTATPTRCSKLIQHLKNSSDPQLKSSKVKVRETLTVSEWLTKPALISVDFFLSATTFLRRDLHRW